MSAEWINGSLGSLFDTVTGSTPPKSNPENYGKDVLFVKPPELKDGLITETADGLSHHGSSIARVLPADSILISCIGNLGKVGLTESPVAFNQQINAIKPSDKTLPLFMFYQSLAPHFVSQLENLVSGTTVPIVNKSKFNSIQIAIPPIPEQQRIVTILDQAFADIEKARANTEKNLKNARELFDSYLNQVLSGEIAEVDCRKHKLFQVATIVSGGTPKSGVSEYWGNDIRWITPKDLGQLTSKYVSETGRRISKLGLAKSSAKLIASNSVILSTRAPIGHLAINTEPMCTNQGCRGLTPKSDLNTEYLYYFLLRSVDLLNELGTGTTFKELSKTALMGVKIPLPSITEQHRIVDSLDKLSGEVQQLEQCYQEKLESLDELKKSLLQKAFSGELTKTKGHAA